MAKPPGALDGLDKAALKDAVRMKLTEQLAELDGVDVSAPSPVVGVGSVVDVQEAGGRRIRYFLLPAGGGLVVGKMVSAATVLQPDSAVGRILLGKRAGDAVVLPGDKPATVLEVA